MSLANTVNHPSFFPADCDPGFRIVLNTLLQMLCPTGSEKCMWKPEFD